MSEPAAERIEQLQRVLLETEDEGERALAHLELARLALQADRYEAAVRHLREALVLDRQLDRARALLRELGELSGMVVEEARSRRKAVKQLVRRLVRRPGP